MILDTQNIVVITGILSQFIIYIRLFTSLEGRLTKIETTLDLLTKNLVLGGAVERRDTGV